MFLCLPCLFFPPLSASCPHICVRGSLPPKPPLWPLPPSLTSLCSGDSPEQRSAAAWQRASSVLSLSGDHQWDLHPCACAKLAGGLLQSHTRHYGVCVASPIHLHLSFFLFAVPFRLFVPFLLLSRQHAQIYESSLSIPIAFVLQVRSYNHISDHSRQIHTDTPGCMLLIYLIL